MPCGGSAVPAALLQAFEARGVGILQGWGMTEMSPLGTTAALKRKHLALDPATQTAIKLKQGRPVFGVEMKIVDDAGNALPQDGKAVGELVVRGPWIASGYFENDAATEAAVQADGWFHTGDVAAIDPDGYVQYHRPGAAIVIVRRMDQLDCSKTRQWPTRRSPRPRRSRCRTRNGRSDRCSSWCRAPGVGRTATSSTRCSPGQHFPKWMLPDDVVIIDELPHTATGKIMKSKLREMFADYVAPDR